MKTTIIADVDTHLDAIEEMFDWADSIDMAYAWICSSAGEGPQWQALPLDKVGRAVVGTAFARTEPAALAELDKVPDRLRLAINRTGTFHPKVIIARRGTRRRALVGSANFTAAAFSCNTELSVLLEGNESEPAFNAISEFVNRHWREGSKLRSEWLADYEKLWDRERRRRVFVPGAKLDTLHISSLEMCWDEYVELIGAQEGRPLSNNFRICVFGPRPSYSWELDEARDIFAAGESFANLDKRDRDLLMGLGRSCGLLGTMRAAGYAKEISNLYPERIAVTLDRLPLRGAVSIGDAGSLLEGLTAHKGISIGVASRLLSVKRPDVFVSVNNGSRPELERLRNGRKISTEKHYIDLLKCVWATEWHRSPRPTRPEEVRIWDRRAALLDSALYEFV